MNTKKTLSDWLNIRYLLILRNEENFEERSKILLTPAKMLFFSFLIFMLIFMIGFLIASQVYNRTLITGEDATLSRKIYKLTLAVDSLGEALQERDQFITNFQKVIGEDRKYLTAEPLKDAKIDTTQKLTPRNDSIKIEYMEDAEKKLRKDIESNSSVSSWGFGSSITVQDLKEQFFFSPVKGLITDKYNSKNAHYGVDIVAQKDEPIKAIADGTVVMATWTDDTGYVIGIQHQTDLISFYKHCSSLLKKTGDFVKVGEIIAIIGNSGELTTGTHLHFEIWYKGSPINPEDFITF